MGSRGDYHLEVVDLAETLNRVDTHASAFDAHPNEAAHRVAADVAYETLMRAPAR